MPFYINYNTEKLTRKKKPLLLKTCKCGNETHQDDGVCVICRLDFEKLRKRTRRVKGV